MPTPAEIKAVEAMNEAGRLVHWLEALEKCPGWTQYLLPKIFAAYEAARERIITAHASGNLPDPKDIATLQGFHEVVTTVRQEKTTAINRLKTSR